VEKGKDMNTWLHRISHHAETSYPLLEKGYLTIGFSDFCQTDFIAKTVEEGWSYFNSVFQEEWGKTPRTRHSLWRFICEMKKGDWVLVPSWGTFSVYQIEDKAKPITLIDIENLRTWSETPVTRGSDGLYCNDKLIDLGFFRKVSLIKGNISRYDYADSGLTSRMKIRDTNTNITDLAQSIQKAITAYRENRPINLHSQIMRASKKEILNLIINELNPDKFEHLLKWYFEKVGASEVYIPPKKEREKQGDADVVAVFEPIKTIFYVQAKYHQGETSDWAAQQIKEYTEGKNKMDDGYSKIGWVVSTSERFSKECMDLAKEHAVSLFSGLDIAQMILEAGIENLDKAL